MGFLPYLELTDTHLIFHESQSFSEKFDLKRQNPRIEISYDQRLVLIHSGSVYYYFLYENGRSKRITYTEFLKYKWRFMYDNIIAVKTTIRKSEFLTVFFVSLYFFTIWLTATLIQHLDVHPIPNMIAIPFIVNFFILTLLIMLVCS